LFSDDLLILRHFAEHEAILIYIFFVFSAFRMESHRHCSLAAVLDEKENDKQMKIGLCEQVRVN